MASRSTTSALSDVSSSHPVQSTELTARINNLTATKAEPKRQLIACAADIANTTAGTGKNKSGSDYLDKLSKIKISPDASSAEHAKSIRDLVVAWLGKSRRLQCMAQERTNF